MAVNGQNSRPEVTNGAHLPISRHTTQSHLCRPLTHLLKQGLGNKNVVFSVVVIHASIIQVLKKYNKKNMNIKVLEMQLYRVF